MNDTTGVNDPTSDAGRPSAPRGIGAAEPGPRSGATGSAEGSADSTDSADSAEESDARPAGYPADSARSSTGCAAARRGTGSRLRSAVRAALHPARSRVWAGVPGWALTGVATVAAGLGVSGLGWALPAAVLAFLAGCRTRRTRPTALYLTGVGASGVVAASLVPAWLAPGGRFVTVWGVAVVLPWFVGRFCHQYRALVRAGWDRAAHLERERRLVAERARLRERARIAQDMHDVLGHDLSLIALSAGALHLAPDLAEPQRTAAREIRARAESAVERLGEVIGVLREEADRGPAEPPDTDLGRLVDAAGAAGLTVRATVDEAPDHLPATVARAAHRVVQEALTNAARHAPGAPVSVVVSHGGAVTEVRVTNPLSVPAPRGGDPVPGRGGGSGLIGLAERVRLAGGTFRHDRRGGAFTVVARIPHAPPVPAPRTATPLAGVPTPAEPSWEAELPDGVDAAEAEGDGPDDADVDPRHRAHRAGRLLLTSVMVPLSTAAVLGAGLLGWQAVTTSWSVLEPDDYARLRVGQHRAELAPLLPDRQAAEHPPAREPGGAGVRCEYYAMTANPFDDRSGDAYRLCFQGDVLRSLDALTR